MLEFLFNKDAGPKACNFIKRLQYMCFPMKFANFLRKLFYRTTSVAASENDEQKQLSEGFPNSCYKIVSPILPQELINNFAVGKHHSGTLLIVADVTSSHGFGN